MKTEITGRKLNSLGFRKIKGSTNPEYYVFTPHSPCGRYCKQVIIGISEKGVKRYEMVADEMIDCSPLLIRDVKTLMSEVMMSAFKDGRKYQVSKINEAMVV